MLGKRLSDATSWVIAACLSISLLSVSIYINSAPTLSISCVKCEEAHSQYGVCTLMEEYCLWGVIVKQEWVLLASYLILFLLATYAIILAVERVFTFNAVRRKTSEFQQRMGDAWFWGQQSVAARLALEYPESPLAFVVNASLEERNNEGESRPVMRLRQQAIVAKTIEFKRGLWQLSAIGYALGFLALLLFCASVINAGQMIRYDVSFFSRYISRVFSDSLYLIVYCVLAEFVVLIAHKFLTARVEQFQLEMDRLSLAFVERLTIRSPSIVSVRSYETAIISDKRTAGLETSAL